MNSLLNNNDHLLIFFLDDSQLQFTISLTQQIYTIGRSTDCEIKLRSGAVSRHHATLVKKELPTGDSFYVLIDGNLEKQASQNGTLVNRKKIVQHQLQDGDLIYFGNKENQAIYKSKKDNSNLVNSNRVLFSEVDINSPQNVDKKTEELQDTLIIYEEQLSEKLKTQDIEHLASFAELSPNPIIEFDFEGNIIYFNPSAKLCFSPLLTTPQPDTDNCLLSSLPTNSGQLNGELIIREVQYEGKFYEQYIHYLSKKKVIRSYIFDITKRKNTEAKLQYQAFHDFVTGIPNRSYFYLQLQKSLQEKQNINKSIAILFIDIDRFKNINDTLSHMMGDKLLECFAYRLICVLPPESFLARWGGDEFVLIAPLEEDLSGVDDSSKQINHNSQIATNIANLILTSVKKPFVIGEHTIHITCSIGLSIYPDDTLDEKQLVKYADIALSKVKQMGKNNYQFYLTQFDPEQTLLFELEHSLHSAIKNQELFLNFQPKLNLKENTITGVEVLLRWQRPDMGFVSPEKFIPIAEETGLIIPIGAWVLEKACLKAKKWLNLGYPPLNLAVNVSIKQFQSVDFIDVVKDILNKTQFPAEYLELEITESLLIEDLERAEYVIRELSLIGVHFSLDDFGTGYSSLSYLKKFPFQYIKIDKSFIDDLAFNKQDKALVSAVVTIAKSYNMVVIAEGVETEDQRQILEYLECDIIQGWLISKSLSEIELLAFLDQQKKIKVNSQINNK